MLEPIKKTRLYEKVIGQILNMVKNGELKPGDRLPTERDLAIQLHVSRTAIREALRSMEFMGLIESKVGGGTFIKEMTMDDLMDPFAAVLANNERLIIELIEVRLLLEVEIAKTAARRMSPKKAHLIENSLNLMKSELEAGRLGLEGDNAFHQALADAADNLAMMNITRLCSELLSQTREAALTVMEDRLLAIEHHQAIFEAVKNHDAAEAGRLMQIHLETAFHNLLEQHKAKMKQSS
jgi:GntR family transcriptional repressor for pyruvate dehydrogenase complex